jgi:CRISPR-associated protein Csm3
MNIQLLGYQKITGTITCITGLRIGGSSEVIEIGGLDNPIIKHPLTNEPYVPGSSLKGKMRALLEMRYGMIDGRAKIKSHDGKEYDNRDFGDVHSWGGVGCQKENCPICRIFGVAKGEGSPFGPSRLIVRDARLVSNGSADKTRTERKWENVINRIKGTAEHPRQMERVPAGTTFKLEMDYRVFDVDDDKGATDLALFVHVLRGLRLIELDTLGGSGSRGYGKVSFETVTIHKLDGTTETREIAKEPL